MALRRETPVSMMATPKRPLRLRIDGGEWETITPGVSWFAPDHEVVRQHRGEFATFTAEERRAHRFTARLERAAEPPPRRAR
jgi:hypothetical protein